MARPEDEQSRVMGELVLALDAEMNLRWSEALEELQRTARKRELGAVPLKLQSDVASHLGVVQLELGDLEAAEKELGRCPELHVRAQVAASIGVSACIVGAARLELRKGHFAEAEELLRPLVTSWEQASPASPRRGEALHWLAEAERGQGKTAAARRDAALADELLGQSPLPALRRLQGRSPTRRSH
jgi:hypothetical protein